jgi:hypothetical protein
MMPLSRIGDRAYPVSRDAADSRREEEARQRPIEATVVEARPANWFAVRVEIVSGDPSQRPARPAPVPSENALYERSRQAPSAIETPPSASQSNALILPATTPAVAVVAGRLGTGEVSRALAAYGAAQMQASEGSQPARASQRLSIRA